MTVLAPNAQRSPMLLILPPLFRTFGHHLLQVAGVLLAVAFITNVFTATVNAENIAPIALESPILPDDDVSGEAKSVVDFFGTTLEVRMRSVWVVGKVQ